MLKRRRLGATENEDRVSLSLCILCGYKEDKVDNLSAGQQQTSLPLPCKNAKCLEHHSKPLLCSLGKIDNSVIIANTAVLQFVYFPKTGFERLSKNKHNNLQIANYRWVLQGCISTFLTLGENAFDKSFVLHR
jgi:hypothetical protein